MCSAAYAFYCRPRQVYNVEEQRTYAAAWSVEGETRICRREMTSCAAAEEEDDARFGVGPWVVTEAIRMSRFERKDNGLQMTLAPSMEKSKLKL